MGTSRGLLGTQLASALVAALTLSLPRVISAQSGDPAVAAWATSHAVPLGDDLAGMRRLGELIPAFRLLGVGESVHGVDAFARMRARLLEEMIQRQRVSVVILESGLPESLALDRFVRSDTDAVDLRSAVGADFADVPTMQEFFRWLRHWNQTEGRSRQVGVLGADISIGDGRSLLPALTQLQLRVGSDSAVASIIDSIRPLAARVSASWWGAAAQRYASLPDTDRRQLRGLSDRLVAAVEAASPRHVPNANDRIWARRFAVLIGQGEQLLRIGASSPENPRDVAMADNISWILDRLPAGAGAAWVAHNAHIQRVSITGPATRGKSVVSSGVLLASSLGADYFAVGTTFGGPLDSIAGPMKGSVDDTLGSILRSSAALVLRGASRNKEVADWLGVPRPMRFQKDYLIVPISRAFDAMIFFDRIMPSGTQ